MARDNNSVASRLVLSSVEAADATLFWFRGTASLIPRKAAGQEERNHE